MDDWKNKQKIWDNSITIGHNVKLVRENAGLSQETIAQRLGVAFQQVQKYEKGANRINAASLWEISTAVNCDIREFFIGLNEDDLETDQPITDLIENIEAFKVATKLLSLSSTQLKAVSKIIDLIE